MFVNCEAQATLLLSPELCVIALWSERDAEIRNVPADSGKFEIHVFSPEKDLEG